MFLILDESYHTKFHTNPPKDIVFFWALNHTAKACFLGRCFILICKIWKNYKHNSLSCPLSQY